MPSHPTLAQYLNLSKYPALSARVSTSIHPVEKIILLFLGPISTIPDSFVQLQFQVKTEMHLHKPCINTFLKGTKVKRLELHLSDFFFPAVIPLCCSPKKLHVKILSSTLRQDVTQLTEQLLPFLWETPISTLSTSPMVRKH